MRGALPFACSVVLMACGGAPVAPRLPTEGEWALARARLADLRSTEPGKPFGAVVEVSLREPHSGKTFRARGAVAVDPHHAVRMVLLGPAGVTALDLWATRDAWRFEVPALSLLRRGGADADASLPIAFFRWWFLTPLDGRLLVSFAGRPSPTSERFILRNDAATIDLVDAPTPLGHAVLAERRENGVVDRIDFRGRSFGVSVGDCAAYDAEASGVHVEVTVESLSDAPPPSAFDDPDTAGQGARGS